MWCQYTLIKCNNSPFPEVDVLRQISLQRFMPRRCISQLFPLLRVQSISALFGKTRILQDLSRAIASSISTAPLFKKVFLQSETHPGAKSLFSLSSSS